MPLVAGIDSSTQSCKVVIRDADTGELVRSGSAAHPPGTEIDPAHWWTALTSAVAQAGGLADVAAVSVAGQQHGMVCLDADGAVVRDALLWNDLRSAPDAADLVGELPGGAAAWAAATGSVPLASFTVTKLRWLARVEPQNAARTAAVCLPHDWLSWQLAGAPSLEQLVTDRGDASGTGYWSPSEENYRLDLLELAFGARPRLPAVLGPGARAADTVDGAVLGAGTGDNAAAALALDARPGDVIVSIGTSGVISAITTAPVADASGLVAGFADAAGGYLPLACTLNAARVLEAAARLLGVSLEELARLALSAPAGSGGLVFVPYLEGERTPNRPEATGAIHGARLDNTTPQHLARAAVEGMLCGLADGLAALVELGIDVGRALLIGGGARSPAVQRIAPDILGVPVQVPPAGEYVADGAARQAGWVLAGTPGPPSWSSRAMSQAMLEPGRDGAGARIRDQYRAARDLVLKRSA
jgi:xylulokinase